MLANKNKSYNFSAVSSIDEKPIMFMNATFSSSNEDLMFSQSIQDIKLYKTYKDQVDKDYSTWKEEVYNEVFKNK